MTPALPPHDHRYPRLYSVTHEGHTFLMTRATAMRAQILLDRGEVPWWLTYCERTK